MVVKAGISEAAYLDGVSPTEWLRGLVWKGLEASRRKQARRSLALLLFVAASACSTATAPEPVGRVSVEVRDAGTPLVGARVTLGGITAATALTDSGGSVRFDDLPLGTYGLTVARPPPGFHCGESVGFELRRNGEHRHWLFSCRRR